MSLITSILPGLRDLRAPIAAGSLWLVTAALLLIPHEEKLSKAFSEETRFVHDLDSWNGTILPLAFPFAAYVVGIILVGTSRSMLRLTLLPLRRIIRFGRSSHDRGIIRATNSRGDALTAASVDASTSIPANNSPPLEADRSWRKQWISPVHRVASAFFHHSARLRSMVALLSGEGRGRMRLTVRRALEQCPAQIRDIFPVAAAIRDFPATILALSKESPEQFQEVDRIRAEADFRFAISPPVATIVFILAHGTTWWLATLGAGPVLLLWQHLRLRQEANDLLATAIYLGYTQSPILKAVTNQVVQQSQAGWDHILNEPNGPAKWVAATLRDNGVDIDIRQDFRRKHEVDI